MKRVFFLSFFLKGAILFSSVILTNTLGEYFDTQNNSTERYIYGNLNLSNGIATLHIFSPLLTTEVEAEVDSQALAKIKVKEALKSKTLLQIAKDGHLSADIEITATPNLSANPGYQVVLNVYGQTLNTNIVNTPNPVQYFLLQMNPLTAGIVNNVFCDLLFEGKATDKWLVPAQNDYPSLGIFLSQTWKTNQIIQTETNSTNKVTFSLNIPATSFVNLKDGEYQIRIAAIMGLPITTSDGNQPNLIPTQINSLLFLETQALSTLQGQNGIFKPTTEQKVIITQNVEYLNSLITAIIEANL